MSYYFDPTYAADLKLLNAAVRSDDELANVSNPTEDYVRERYTSWNGVSYDVELRGYEADPADATDPFKKAYKQTIADAISYRLLYYSEHHGLKQDKRRQRSQEYFESFNPDDFPIQVFKRLDLFDISGVTADDIIYGI